MIRFRFVDDHRDAHGVKRIRRVLEIDLCSRRPACNSRATTKGHSGKRDDRSGTLIGSPTRVPYPAHRSGYRTQVRPSEPRRLAPKRWAVRVLRNFSV
jgi:hypothetical protein